MTSAPPPSSKPFTLYTSKLCPYAHRTELALHESQQFDNVELVQIDLLKPREAWYLEKINSVGKVPALEVSEHKTIIPESLVIANYVAESYPESGLLPNDPLERARVRYVIERAAQLIGPHYPAALMKRDEESLNGLYTSLEELEKLFNSISTTGPFIFGEKLSLADIAVAPFLARILATTDEDLGIVPAGLISPPIPERMQTQLPRLKNFFDAIKSRQSWASTFDEDFVRKMSKQAFLAKAKA
ncbi:hypothetical protein CF319_g4829 [Tilletia indica]|nr:hypothetical protein CF319_g4829 [Tilletia indica]